MESNQPHRSHTTNTPLADEPALASESFRVPQFFANYIQPHLHARTYIAAAGVVVLAGAALATGTFLFNLSIPGVQPSGGNAANTTTLSDTQAIAPDGKSTSDLSDWTRLSPPDSDPVFAYTDTVGGTTINVTQQPLPQKFTTNTDTHVAELALTYSATTKLSADDTTFYVGSSSKGPQSVIFTKKDMLVMIKSHAKVDDGVWIDYILSLK